MNLKLRELRRSQELSQSALAVKVGVSERKLAGWERGETKITLEDALACAEALGCTPNDLCDWYATHPRPQPRERDPEHAMLVEAYDACTPARRRSVMQQARDAAFASKEFAERADDVAQGA